MQDVLEEVRDTRRPKDDCGSCGGSGGYKRWLGPTQYASVECPCKGPHPVPPPYNPWPGCAD
jgi:hypothetical protein